MLLKALGEKAELSPETRSAMIVKIKVGIKIKDIASEYHLPRQLIR